jgi:hypothetical protein
MSLYRESCAAYQFGVNLQQHIATVAAHSAALLNILPLQALSHDTAGQADRQRDRETDRRKAC